VGLSEVDRIDATQKVYKEFRSVCMQKANLCI